MTVADRDFSDLVAQAEQILVGTVAAIETGENERGGAMTFVSFTELTVLKGNVAPPFVLQLHGGQVRNGLMMHVPDMPHFTTGETAVLFVRGNGRDFCPLVGVWQGRFRVTYDEERQAHVVRNHDGRLVTGFTGTALESADDAKDGGGGQAIRGLTLAEFSDLVHEEMRHPSK